VKSDTRSWSASSRSPHRVDERESIGTPDERRVMAIVASTWLKHRDLVGHSFKRRKSMEGRLNSR
jgi:hypothetical protein